MRGGDSDQRTIYSVVSTTRRKSGQEFSGDKDVAVVMQLLWDVFHNRGEDALRLLEWTAHAKQSKAELIWKSEANMCSQSFDAGRAVRDHSAGGNRSILETKIERPPTEIYFQVFPNNQYIQINSQMSLSLAKLIPPYLQASPTAWIFETYSVTANSTSPKYTRDLILLRWLTQIFKTILIIWQIYLSISRIHNVENRYT